MTLAGKTAVVTGATSGIGRAIARSLVEEGARVALLDIAAERGAEAVAALGGDTRALFVRADVADGAAVRTAIGGVIERFGRLDILVNNAGLQHVAPVAEFPEEKWQQLVGVMLTGTFLCTKHALPAMRERGWGRVINIASAHGLVASPFKSAYVAAKHGIVGFTKSLALEVAREGITANAICPGYVRTPLVEAQLEDQARVRGIPVAEVAEQVILAPMPQKEFIDADAIGALVLYLCSDAARGINGATLSIDGGWTSQ